MITPAGKAALAAALYGPRPLTLTPPSRPATSGLSPRSPRPSQTPRAARQPPRLPPEAQASPGTLLPLRPAPPGIPPRSSPAVMSPLTLP